jgi:RHS repeat-associated protein
MHLTLTSPAQSGGRFFRKECVRGYRFGFNGKEKVDEVYGDANAYDFGARLYDPRLGRWLAVDPLAAKFANISPYVYANNNPIVLVDKDGKEPKPPQYEHYSGKGNVLIIIADSDNINYDCQTANQCAHNWDIVVVSNAQEGVDWVKSKYSNSSQKISNLVFDSHSSGTPAENILLNNKDDAYLSSDKVKRYPNIDCETKEQVDALYSLNTLIGDGAIILFTACEIAKTDIGDKITDKLPGNYTLILNKNSTYTMIYTDKNNDDKYDFDEPYHFPFDQPITIMSKGASEGFSVFIKDGNNVTKTSTNLLGGENNSIQLNSSGGGKLVKPKP